MNFQSPSQTVSAGDLNRRVTIEQLSTAGDRMGGASSTWTTLTTVWAKVSPKSGVERLHADQLTPTITYVVTIRYRKDVDASMRLVYESRTLRINSVIDQDEQHRFLVLACDEWPAAAN